ncbi:Uncharacterised protein [Salmonella enterica subsp. enterica serovar Bovismorbificans]|uniref:Uncharacterized protein n=1 Tax=Salmonella enterica subsp. enterica serovar Bovismorbificans TaxID=58097 RepID=A0A655DNR4_SALET|nr:Uncharacterised protein [Salmonella enterica subsp. enterica serovar Bovismorbificans]
MIHITLINSTKITGSIAMKGRKASTVRKVIMAIRPI